LAIFWIKPHKNPHITGENYLKGNIQYPVFQRFQDQTRAEPFFHLSCLAIIIYYLLRSFVVALIENPQFRPYFRERTQSAHERKANMLIFDKTGYSLQLKQTLEEMAFIKVIIPE
jgi:hypothetical protein